VARREEALEREIPTRVPLARPIRVLILYGTALAKEDGTVQFFEDIYGHDEPLARKLSSRRR
jgi:murein L,D-transpeptidase YcbB/YkuD